MRPGHSYKHINCLDMGMKVLKIPYHNSKYLKAKVTLFHLTLKYIYETLEVKINLEDLRNWKEIE